MKKRIYILGGLGTGKNWLGERLNKKLGVRFYDLDDLTWKKKYTIERSRAMKARMLDRICSKDEWIIGGVGISFVGRVPKRATEIIILKEKLSVESCRILRRYVKNKFRGKSDRLKFVISAGVWNYKNCHRVAGKLSAFYKELEKKYPKKVVILNKKGVGEYLKKLL